MRISRASSLPPAIYTAEPEYSAGALRKKAEYSIYKYPPDISRCDGDEFYVYLLNGYDAPDMKAEEKMRTGHGRIFSLKAKAPGMRIKTVKKQ